MAHDQELGIGKDNQLPWHIPKDLKHFREITTFVTDTTLKNAVVMGRKTWESIPPNQRPLQNRQNIILTRNELFSPPDSNAEPGTIVVRNLEEAITKIRELPIENCFVIGGSEVYRQAIALPVFNRLYITEILGTFACDVFFPEYRPSFLLVEQSEWIQDASKTFRFCMYEKN